MSDMMTFPDTKIADDLHVSSATISTRLKQEEGENAKLD